MAKTTKKNAKVTKIKPVEMQAFAAKQALENIILLLTITKMEAQNAVQLVNALADQSAVQLVNALADAKNLKESNNG